VVQHILYDAGDVTRFQGLAARGLIPLERASALFVLARA
jgi:3-keto-5-aminohexanoate cleavage enzyme